MSPAQKLETTDRYAKLCFWLGVIPCVSTGFWVICWFGWFGGTWSFDDPPTLALPALALIVLTPLVSTVSGIGAIWAYLRARREGETSWMAPAGLALGIIGWFAAVAIPGLAALYLCL